ncbi:MAG: M12 family metallo-peptidase [Candidatus Kapabacteria bacterium]|nr:M12 family metallo-peptidase [Candidatus Kapabacteria bacterium]
MSRYLVVILVFVSFATVGAAQNTRNVFQRTTGTAKGETSQSVQIVIKPEVVRDIVRVRDERVGMSIPMPDGTDLSLILTRFTVTNAASRLTVMTENGPVHSSLGESLAWYRAALPGGGMVVMTLNSMGDASGIIDNASGRYLLGRKRSDNDDEYVVMRDHDAPYSCATPIDKLSRELKALIDEAPRVHKTAEGTQASDTLTVEVAVEADYDLFQGFGTKVMTTTYITQLIAAMSTVYERELSVRFVITNVRVWETAADPYDDNLDVFGLLGTFVDEYRANMANVPRDLAIFMTSRGGQGGIAKTIGGICQEDGSYCAGDVVRKISTYPTWSWDVGMMTHEVGHICGGIHTQSCYWPKGPLDSCVQSESGPCVPYDLTGPTRGTIMSYCHQQIPNGAVMTLEFHPLHRNVMKSYIRSAACIGNAPRPRTNRLIGRALDAITQTPLAGVSLTIRPVVDDVYRQTLSPGGDTVAVTAADGSYSFSQLGLGLYELIIAPPFVSFPLISSDQARSNGVMVADTVTKYDLKLVKGQAVELIIANDGDTTPVTLNLYSEQIPELLTTTQLPVSTPGDTAIRVVRAMPIGRYVVVPAALGRHFTPNKIVVDLVVSEELRTVRFGSSSTLPKLTSSVALGVGNRDGSVTPPRYTLTSGMPYVATEIQSGKVVSTGTIPEDGVLVIDSLPAEAYYRVQPLLDTNASAPYVENTFLYPMYSVYAGLYVQQPRRKPLLARSYSMTTLVTSYSDLVDPIIIRDPSLATPRTAKVPLPYTISILGRELTSMFITRNGFVSFGGIAFNSNETTPIDSYDEAMLIISPFACELHPDTNAPSPWRISWVAEGSVPNRVVKVEWRNFMVRFYNWNTGQAKDVGRFSFQLHLYENGQIDFVYDAPADVTEQLQAEIGLRGNDILDNQLLLSLAEDDLEDVRAVYVPGGYSLVSMKSNAAIKKGLTYRWELGATDVEETVVDDYSISPTPASSTITVGGVHSSTSVRIVDALGSTVMTVMVDQGASRINVGSLANGRYTAIMTSGGLTGALPILVQH